MPVYGIVDGGGEVAVGVGGNNVAASGGGSNMNLWSSTICPICGRSLRHPKALYGHMRWHSTDAPAVVKEENYGLEVETSTTTTLL